MSESATPAASRSKLVIRILLLVVILAACVFALRWVKEHGLFRQLTEFLKQVENWIEGLGPWGPVAFIVIYVVAVMIPFVPASVFTLGAGLAFGMVWGSVYVLVAANIAGCLNFLIGRYLARDWVAHKLEAQPKFRAIDEATAREGWKIVALIRLAPVFPFSIMSYAFGLTRVSFWSYAAANLAMIPGTLMYVYLGYIGRATDKPKSVIIGGLVLGIIAVLYITRVAKRALSQKIYE